MKEEKDSVLYCPWMVMKRKRDGAEKGRERKAEENRVTGRKNDGEDLIISGGGGKIEGEERGGRVFHCMWMMRWKIHCHLSGGEAEGKRKGGQWKRRRN